MNVTGPSDATPGAVRQPVLLGLFAGTAVGAGYLLAAVPNVELMTFVVALAGAVMGARSGALCGALAAAVYSLGSPYGLPAPLLLLAQAAGFAVTGWLGAVMTPSRPRRASTRQLTARAAATAVLATAVYQVLTNVTGFLMFDVEPRAYLAMTLPYALIHLGANTAIFVALFPLLVRRLAGLAGPRLVGRGGAAALALAALALAAEPAQAVTVRADTDVPDPATRIEAPAVAAPDSVVRRPPAPEPAGPLGWKRPLWEPFAPTFLDWAKWYSPLAVYRDGGVGAQARVLGEAGAAAGPLVVRDGIPLGTGHALADDPWLVPREGLDLRLASLGADGWGGAEGLITTDTWDPEPDRAVSRYQGHRGPHETYYRGVTLQTTDSSWRAAFGFDESLDNEGYNHTDASDGAFASRRGDGFTGQGKVRLSRIRVSRSISARDGFWFEVDRGRRTRDELTVLDAGYLQAWDRGVAAVMRAGLGGVDLRARVFSRSRDVEWGDRWTTATGPDDLRLLETTRSGARLDLTRVSGADSTGRRGDAWRLSAQVLDWRLHDSGVDAAWAEGHRGRIRGDGLEARATAGTDLALGGLQLAVDGGGVWARDGGAGPEATARLAPAGGDEPGRPHWGLDAYLGGRAPRSDELLTPLRLDVDGRGLALLPNAGLEREKTLRLGAVAGTRLLGLDLAVDGSWRRLRDGIAWEASADDPDRGAWQNGLDLTAVRLTASVAHAGRFLGWGRARLEGTWQNFDLTRGRTGNLPPEQMVRLHLMWENHFFQEDGILQLALLSTLQGERHDPWDASGETLLPSATIHDLIAGFRLVGVHLSLALRNLTGERAAMSAGARSPGQETQLRLSWTFHH